MPVATVHLPADVAARLQEIGQSLGLKPSVAAGVLLTLLLRQADGAAAARRSETPHTQL